jgi:hypothetical protein
MNVRGPQGQKTVTITTSGETQFTRYVPESVKYTDAKPSSFADLKPGDQLRILGNANADGTTIAAERVISGAFRTISATIVSVASDGKQMQVNDTQTKSQIVVTLTDDSAVRRLPPPVAAMLAKRLSPGSKPGAANNPEPTPEAASGPSAGASQPDAGDAAARPSGRPPGSGRNGGDISQMLERLPKIPASELKIGEPVIISGGSGDDKTHLTAINVISGVEPLFASSPSSAGRSSALGMWSLDIGSPGEQ